MRRIRIAAAVVALLATTVACAADDTPEPGGTSGTKVTLAFSAWPGWFDRRRLVKRPPVR